MILNNLKTTVNKQCYKILPHLSKLFGKHPKCVDNETFGNVTIYLEHVDSTSSVNISHKLNVDI